MNTSHAFAAIGLGAAAVFLPGITGAGELEANSTHGTLAIDDMHGLPETTAAKFSKARSPETKALPNSFAGGPADNLAIDNMEKEPGRSGGLPVDLKDGISVSKQSPSGIRQIQPTGETNCLGGKNGVYHQEPSSADYVKSDGYGKVGSGLKISYEKKGKGGPRNDGGFCGYYTLLHAESDDYLDASEYNYVAFWVKGDKGNDNLTLNVVTDAGVSVNTIDLVLEGNPGHDTCTASANVGVQRCSA